MIPKISNNMLTPAKISEKSPIAGNESPLQIAVNLKIINVCDMNDSYSQ